MRAIAVKESREPTLAEAARGVSAILDVVPIAFGETFHRLALPRQDSIATDLERTAQ